MKQQFKQFMEQTQNQQTQIITNTNTISNNNNEKELEISIEIIKNKSFDKTYVIRYINKYCIN